MFSHSFGRTPSSHIFGRVNFSRDPHCRMFFTADDGANNNGGDNQSQNNQSQNSNQSGNNQSVAEAVKNAIADILGAKGGDKDAALETLIRKNHKLEERAAAAERNQLPKADRELLTKFKELNLSIDDVTRITAEHKQWGDERAKSAKLDGLKKAAEKAGLNPELLASLDGALDADYTVIGEGENAKAVVKVKNGDTVSDKALSDWVGEKWPGLVETLKAPSQGGQQQQQQPRVVTSTHKGAPAGGGQAPNKFQAIRQEAEERKKSKQTGGTLKERMGVKAE